jgi:hydrogenase nickel incorporation protein HypA/HybF
MHELSIAQGIVEVVRKHLPMDEVQEVKAVRLRIGDQVTIVPDSLQFCFDLACEGTILQGARLEIENVPGDGLQVVEVEVEG